MKCEKYFREKYFGGIFNLQTRASPPLKRESLHIAWIHSFIRSDRQRNIWLKSVTEENRNHPINRSQSMWRLVVGAGGISLKNIVTKCIWIGALGAAVSDQRCRIYNIFNIERLQVHIEIQIHYFWSFQKGVRSPQAYTAQEAVHWWQTLCRISEGENDTIESLGASLITWFLSISASWSSASPCSWKVMMMRATKMLTKKKGKTMK